METAATAMSAVDKLGVAEQNKIKKFSDSRLRSELIKADYATEEVSKMDRTVLMETLAEVWLQPPGETEADRWKEEMRIRREHNQWKQEVWEMERKERMEKDEQERKERKEREEREELERERKRKERREREEREEEEREIKRKERKERKDREDKERKERIEREEREDEERERERKERKERQEKEEQERKERWEQKMLQKEKEEKEMKERWEQERQERHKEQKFREEEAQKREKRQQSLTERLKVAGECLKNILPQQPLDTADVPLFLDTVEKLFATFKTDKDLQVKLLMPLLTNRARAMIGRMPTTDLDDFDKVKKFLLVEYKITPRQIKTQFLTAEKQANETYQLFASRLTTLFNYYAGSRDVVDDYNKLCMLLIADRLKDALPYDALQYVLSLEGDAFFEPSKIAGLADVFVNNCRSERKSTWQSTGFVPRDTKPYPSGANAYRHTEPGFRPSGRGGVTNPNQGTVKKTCYNCGSDKHLLHSCDKPKQNVSNFRGGRGGGRMQVNACSVVQSSTPVGADTVGLPLTDSLASRTEETNAMPVLTAIDHVDCALVKSMAVDDRRVETNLKVSPLHYVDIIANGEKLRALDDSGAQVPVVRRSVLGNVVPVGQIEIQGFVGDPVATPLVTLDVKLAREPVEGFSALEQTTDIVFAVADDLAMQCDVILPSDVVRELNSLTSLDLYDKPINEETIKPSSEEEEKAEEVVNCDSLVCFSVDAIVKSDNVLVPPPGGSSGIVDCESCNEFAVEQSNDVTLSEAFNYAKDDSNGYFTHDGVLYHKDSIAGQVVSQLVVPSNRRSKVFDVAHSSVFSGHLRELKTKQRIKMSFYWPGMTGDIKRWCNECQECQLRARRRTNDRVPITPIARAPLPFHTLNMDVIGPIDDKAPYPWILTIVDSCTRWPSVFLLKSLTARAVCDCLITLFANVGVASVLISDRGTNFTSQMTAEFLKRLGCSPRLLSPNHPQASGLVERFNSTFKGMLAHVVRENPGTWHKLVPLVVWSTREVPNATTGVSPYQMVYGRVPRGVLAVLKESWSGDCLIAPSLAKSTVNYLEDLKERLELAAEYARDHSVDAQKHYADNYNLRAKDKSFVVGERVVVLVRDSTNKVYSRWRMGTVQRVLSKHSYLVDMGDGSVRHLHANHMRKFVAKVQSVVIVREDDSDKDFGRICYPPSKLYGGDVLPSQQISRDQVGPITGDQYVELLKVLDEFADVFVRKPGLCSLIEHRIQTTPDFKPKAFKAYKIPEVLCREVDRQIDQLLEWGFIVPSQSPMASPIVCALKKDQSIRLAVNYIYLNKFTVADAFPMPNAEDVMWRVSQANYISCFDARSGYWQVPMCESDEWLTSFITHRGLYMWKRCPFGLRNSAASFVRMMGLILKPISDFAEAYVDDVGVHTSGEWAKHIDDLIAYLTVMRRANLTLNLKKSTFARPEVKMLGHIIGSGQHRPDPEKISVLQGLDRPSTKTELRRLLGMFGYYRAYISDYAAIASPLTDLTGKEVPAEIPWDDVQEQAFLQLRQAMCSPPVMMAPRWGQPFYLQTDACDVSVGCCVGQWDELGREHPVAYASQKLTKSQCNWAVIEKEAYAVTWALQKYRSIIFGADITVYVDHNPLTYLVESAPKSAKLTRWMLALQEFKVKLVYKRGTDHQVADCLSRIPENSN